MTTPAAATWLLGASTTAKTAHLLLEPNARHGGPVGWCNQSLDASKPAPYSMRCKRCLSLVAQYAESVTADVPARVRTTVHLTIEHNADETAQDVMATVVRRAVPQSARTWRHVGAIAESKPAEDLL